MKTTVFVKKEELDNFILILGGSIKTEPIKSYSPPNRLFFDFNWVNKGVEITITKY